MKIKLLILICILFISNKILGQEQRELITYDGITILYTLNIENKTKKKDFYKTVITVKNTGENNLFYKVKLHKNEKRKWDVSVVPENNAFAKINVKNVTGFFKNGKSLIGDKTSFFTEDNGLLMVLKKGEDYTYKFKFKVKKDITPDIVNTPFRSLKTLDKFDLKITPKLIDGQYSSSCNGIKFKLTFKNTKERGNYIEQTINGKTYIWIKRMGRTYVKLSNSSFWLTFNKKNQTFMFSTPDDVKCIWSKDELVLN